MPDHKDTLEGSAIIQPDLWGQRARNWADVLERWSGSGISLYRHVLERVPAGSGTSLLDVGCGAERLCRMAADRGRSSRASTTPPAPSSRSRGSAAPDGDFRVGDMEDLQWE